MFRIDYLPLSPCLEFQRGKEFEESRPVSRFSGIIVRGDTPFSLPFTVFTFNFTESNVTRGLSVGSRSETNSIAPCDSRGRETWRRAAAADRIRPVRECRTEGERHKNEPAPRDLFTRGKSYGLLFNTRLHRRARREKNSSRRPSADGLATARFFSPLFRYIPPRTNEENIPSMMTLLRSAFFRVRFIVLRDDHRFVSRDS